MELNKIWNGDSLYILREFDNDSIDCIVTDPPYFLINENGSGFMGKSWDSINSRNGYNIICQSPEFAQYVIQFLLSLKVESNTEGVNSVQDPVKTKVPPTPNNYNSNAQSVENNSVDQKAKSKAKTVSAHNLALTKVEVLDLLKELSASHIIYQKFQELSDNVLFVIPYSQLERKLKNIVPESVLRFPIELTCAAPTIQVSLMDEVRINAVIEGMIGNISALRSINETNIVVESAENIVAQRKYRHIISENTAKQKTIQWIIWLLYVLNVTQRRNTIPKSYTINYDLIYQFHKTWAQQALRVLKPGAFAAVMSAPRSDVLSMMIEALRDAGFVISFSPVYWTYASGFPKASNISKLVDKRLGMEREVIGLKSNPRYKYDSKSAIGVITKDNTTTVGKFEGGKMFDTKPASKEAKALDGSYAGAQFKPAVEIVLLVMKPLSEKTFVDQALSNGKGVTWLDSVRIPFQGEDDYKSAIPWSEEGMKGLEHYRRQNELQGYDKLKKIPVKSDIANPQGRFPANLLVSNDVLNDGVVRKSGKIEPHHIFKSSKTNGIYGKYTRDESCNNSYGDSGSYSRYFSLDKWFDTTFPFLVVPKAPPSEKNKGLDAFMPKQTKGGGGTYNEETGGKFGSIKALQRNFHPTCKPIKLMSWLVTLLSRPNDIVLDPFCGSGTTCIAAKMLNRRWIGIEMNKEYVEIAEARVRAY